MLTIWNRRELRNTYSLEEQAQIRSLLSAAGIDYRLVTRGGAARTARYGSAGVQMDTAYEYVFYVHRADYDQARRVIGM